MAITLSARTVLAAAATAAVVALLSSCASYGPQGLPKGAPKALVIERMGVPAMEISREPGALRMVYPRGPMGRHTWMVDMDDQGRLIGWHQALVLEQLLELPVGMTAPDILFRIGPPAERRPRGLKPGQLWSYRYPTNDCLWFQIELDEHDRLVAAGTGIDPRCGDTPTRGPQ